MRRQSRREALNNFGSGFIRIVGFIIISIVVINFLGKDDDTSNTQTVVNRPSDDKVTAIQPVNKTYETYVYKDVARDKDGLAGKHITFEGEVEQVISSGDTIIARISNNGDTNEMYYVQIPESILDYNLLEDDLVSIDGTLYGIETYNSNLRTQISIPGIEADNVELLN